ncbi:MAG: cytochrome c/FTR1 family iron permease [Flavobacteriales bacterium]|nr:cytochrome c/FTR1 family iron permease [Flavobacteriales bacterium]
MNSLRLALIVVVALMGFHVHAAGSEDEQARTVVHMLDYVSVDYPEFVKDGQVLDTAEYAEQLEFAQQVIIILEQLPKVDGGPDLVAHARTLHERISEKGDGVDISALAKALRGEVIMVYRVAVAPRQAPDLATAAALYSAHCASCHGATGHGDGPQAEGMEPAPRNFHDADAMAVRSPFGLYNTITLGVAGTQMLPYSGLSEDERWALAFHSAGMLATPEELKRGEKLWKEGVGKEQFTNLSALVSATPEEVEQQHGAERAAVLAFLIANPAAVQQAAPSPLTVSRKRLDEALEAYRNGDPATARRLSISAYLEGFELVEAALDNVDAPLRKRTEREMMTLRSQIGSGVPSDSVAASIARIHVLLDRADDQLSGDGLTTTAAFISSLLILLREGLEAILVLAAIIAFVLKTGRRDALPYIHAGWIGAVLLGVATWLLARYMINISGADREVTEGVTALLAAAMLLYVGYWLHNKSNTKAWQRFVKDKVNAALSKRTLWALAGISFLAVYRELFEIILFYETLFSQAGPSGQQAVLGGIGAAVILLAIIGGAILKYSVRLPIGPFFAITAALLALMAVVFAGNGVAAMQEAGVFDASFVHFISIPVLGIHPTVQGLLTQGAVLALVIGVGIWGRIRMARTEAV